MRSSLALSVVVLFAIDATAAGQGYSPAEALKRMKVADDLKVKLVASEPLVRQPVAMTFDARGRLWVIQYLQYPTPAGLKAVKVDQFLRTVYDKLPEPPPKGPRGVDRITILEDTDGDGVMDHAKDFVSNLNLATGIAHGYGGVFVAQSPYLLFYPDRNGDDVPDGDPEVLLTGFGMEDAHAFPNSLQFGPDGWLYGAQGSTVTANIRGIRFNQGIWRYHPRTKAFELFAEGGGNTWGLDFDRHGNAIAGTNYGNVAMLHQVQGGYYIKGFEKHGPLQNPYTFGYFDHVPYKGFVGGHVTCGGIIYQGGSLPEKYHNHYLAANLLSNTIDWHIVEPRGSTFSNRRGDTILAANDTWFRGIDCDVGPDGGVYIADWYDKRANHVDPKDDWDRTNGRIYKLENAAGMPKIAPFDLEKLPSIELTRMYNHRNAWFRRTARRILSERRDPSVVPFLKGIALGRKDDSAALEAFWMLYVSGGLDPDTLLAAVGHWNADVRCWATRFIGDDPELLRGLDRRLQQLAEVRPRGAKTITSSMRLIAKLGQSEKDPSVRAQLACSARRFDDIRWLAAVRSMTSVPADVHDPQIPLLLWWAIESKAVAQLPQLMTALEDRSLWSSRILTEFILERLSRRYAAEGTDATYAACARLLDLAPPQDRPTVLRGLQLGLEGRRFASVPAALAPSLERLWNSTYEDPSLLVLGLRLNYPPGRDRAIQSIADPKCDKALFKSLMEAIGQLAPPELLPTLLKMAAPGQPSATRLAAVAAFRRYNDPRVVDFCLREYRAAPVELRPKLLDLLASRPASARLLLQTVDAGAIASKEVGVDQLQAILLHNDPKLATLVEKHWGKIQPQSTGEKKARIHGIRVSLGLAKGRPEAGHALFTKHCGTCHTLFGEGAKVGPELTGADRRDLNFLLTSIVDPSAVIRKEYMSHTVATTDGRVLTGLIAECTPNAITLLDAKNQRTTIPQSDVEAIKPSPNSLMPEKILDELDPQQVRDLIAWLQKDVEKKK